jgi:PAS domain S-box-containing protein
MSKRSPELGATSSRRLDIADSDRGLLEALVASRDLLSETQRIAHVGSWDWNIAEGSLTWTEEIYRIFGIDPEEFGASYEAFLARVHPDDREKVDQAVAKALKQEAGYDIEHRVVRPDGELRTVHERGEVTFDDSGKPVRMLGTVVDVSEEARLREELARSEAHNRGLIETSADGLLTIDQDGIVDDVNDAYCRMSGYTREELLGMCVFDVEAAEVPEEIAEHMRLCKETGSCLFESRHRTKSGELIDVEVSVTHWVEAHRFILFVRDIRERKRFEEEREVARFFDLALDIAAITNLDEERFLRVNGAFTQILGWTAEELCSRPFEEFVHRDDLEPTRKALERHLGGREVIDFDNRYRHKDGSYRWLRWRTAPPTDSRIVYATARDVTEERRLEDEREEAMARTRFLQRVSAGLTRAATLEEVGEVIEEEVFSALGVRAGTVGVLDEQKKLILTYGGFGQEFRERLSILPLDSNLPGPTCVRENRARWYRSRAELEGDFEKFASATAKEAEFESACFLPLETRDQAIGFISCFFAEPHAFEQSDRSFFETAAEQCAQVVARARLHAELSESLVRTSALQRVSAALSRAETIRDVLDVVFDEVFTTFAVDAGALGLTNRDGTRIALELTGGDERVSELAVDDPSSPGAFCVRSGEEIWLESSEDVPAGDSFAGAVEEHADGNALFYVPLVPGSGEGAIGFIAARFAGTRLFPESEREFIRSVAGRCAQTLVRVGLSDEREQALRRTRALEAVNAALARAATPAEVGQVIFEHAFAMLGATASGLGLLDERGERLDLVTVGFSEEVEQEFRNLEASADRPGPACVRSRKPSWYSSSAELLADFPSMTDVLGDAWQTAFYIPLIAGEDVLGYLSGYFEEARVFDQSERVFAQTIASQCAQALVRARLYEESEQRAEASFVLDRIGDGIFRLDDEERIRLWNTAAERMTGVSAGDALGKQVGEVFEGWGDPPRALEPALPERPAARRSLPFLFGGVEMWFSISSVRVPSGAVYAFHDVTVEHELERRQHDFIATVSHELRTPLASVYGAVRTLERSEIDSSDRELVLSAAVEQSERLRRLIDEILLANEAGSTQMRMRDVVVDPLEVAFEVTEATRTRLPDGFALELQAARPLPPLHVDPDRLYQVLANLIDNAIKFSPEGGSVRIDVTASDETVLFTVSDEGPGIPASERERVFHRFYRLDPTQSKGVGGSGLGLFICRELVERMGGKISVDARAGGGSAFSVELPRERRRSAQTR